MESCSFYFYPYYIGIRCVEKKMTAGKLSLYISIVVGCDENGILETTRMRRRIFTRNVRYRAYDWCEKFY